MAGHTAASISYLRGVDAAAADAIEAALEDGEPLTKRQKAQLQLGAELMGAWAGVRRWLGCWGGTCMSCKCAGGPPHHDGSWARVQRARRARSPSQTTHHRAQHANTACSALQ